MTFRFVLQRYGTWAWLDYEAPLVTDDGPEWALGAYGIMRATLPSPAAHLQLTAEDGHPLLWEWGTLVHVELGPGDRRWTGIVRTADLTKSGWELTIVEHPGYLDGTPWLGLVRGIRADPADLIRQLVTDTQAWPGAWYGCTVEGSTPVRLGTDLDDRVAAARAVMDARKQQLDSFSQSSRAETKALQDLDSTLSDEVTQARTLLAQAQQQVAALIQSGAPDAQITAARHTVDTRKGVYETALTAYNAEIAAGRVALAQAQSSKEAAQAAYDAAKVAYDVLKERRKDEGGAFEIRGDDLPDTYKAVQDVATTAGVEWSTRTTYSDGAPDVGIVIHYPQAGRRRDDLIFDTSVNILHPLELDSADAYANAAVGVGAGEGDAAVRRTMSVPSPRMRRVTVVEDRAIRTDTQMDAALRAELRATAGDPAPSEIEVQDHPNCPIGAWQVGDVIPISGVTTIGSRWDGLARISSWSWPSRYRARIRLTRVS